MKNLFMYTLLFLLSVKAFSQEFVPTHIAIASQSYFEIMDVDGKYIGTRFYAEKDELKEESIEIDDLQLFKEKAQVIVFEKTKKLKNNWYKDKDIQFEYLGDKLYKVWIKKNGTMRLSFQKEAHNSEYRHWYTPEDQPKFITRKWKRFEILLMVKGNTLNVIYYFKRKGLSGYIEKVTINDKCSC